MKIFISHSSIDKPFVRKLKKDLELNYILTWVDEDELKIGDSLIAKLEEELRNSSHFLIVLSPNSVQSDWVKLELNNALKIMEEEIIKKIIPIHYRKCEMPKSLKTLLNIDLTKETVYMRNGDFEFYGNNYYKHLDQLIRNLKSQELKLSKRDKNSILSENALTKYDEEEITFHFRVIGYKSISNFLANQISQTEKENYSDITKFSPIVLPKQLKPFYPEIKFGDKIVFANKDKEIEGQFARFSTTNNLCLPKAIRDFLEIKSLGVYKVIVNTSNKIIRVELATDK